MHDDRLEQRLRTVLRAEADDLSFTITAAEVERRLVARRRRGVGRTNSLILAAAIGIGLVGVGAAAGAWLDRRTVQTPGPTVALSGLVDRSAAPSLPTGGPPVVRLPNLDEFVAPLDPARLVRAQAVGPAVAPASWSAGGQDVLPSGSTTFAPVAAGGRYQVRVACLGPDPVVVRPIRSGPSASVPDISAPCDGSTTSADMELESGDSVTISAIAPTAWRIALLAPDRPAPHATVIADDVTAAAGKRLDAQSASGLGVPMYGPDERGPFEPKLVGQLGLRDAYRLAVSCGGPSPLTIFMTPNGTPPPPGWTGVGTTATTVECDGRVTVDVLRSSYADGVDLWVAAASQDAWAIAVAFEDPPIASPADGDGWGLHLGLGPSLDFRPVADHLAGRVSNGTSRIRVVITCLGGSDVDVDVHRSETDDASLASFTAPCTGGHARVTSVEVDVPDGTYDVRYVQHGAMWLIVTVQQPLGA